MTEVSETMVLKEPPQIEVPRAKPAAAEGGRISTVKRGRPFFTEASEMLM